VEALTAALREALSATPYELAHKGAEGRVRVAASFDIDSEARKLLGHMQAALDGSRHKGRQAEEEKEALQVS
jgi:hypothetical protein